LKLKPNAVFLLLLAVITVAYANHFQNGFHFDDFHTVVDNPAIRSLGNLPRFFSDANTFSVLPANRTYRPLVSASLALDYALGHGYNPVWFHVVTFLLFLWLIWLLYRLYQVIFDKTEPVSANGWPALLGAAWFGLHPAMAETVNYVIQRGDLYCTLGCVGALVTYALYPARRKYGLYLLPLVAALLSKPPAAVFPFLLLLYVYFFETDGEAQWPRWRASLVAIVPSAVVVGLLLALQSAMTPKTFLPSILSPWDYRLTQPFVWLRYFGALFLPVHLNADTDLNVFTTLNFEACVGLLFLVGTVVAIWASCRRRLTYPIAYGLLWFVITQLPTSLYPLSEVENDHRMFFSFAGLIPAVIWAGALAARRFVAEDQRIRLRPVAVTCAVMVLFGYAYGVTRRNYVWRNDERLWLDDVKKSPHNGRGLMNYALTQMAKGAYPTALRYFEEGLKYDPNYGSLEINLGIVNGAMADEGDTARGAEAERHFMRALDLTPNDDGAHSFYGRWLLQHGRTQEAIEQLKTAIALNPDRTMQREQLISAYAARGDTTAAETAKSELVALAPSEAPTAQALTQTAVSPGDRFVNLSLEQYKLGKYQESIDLAEKALAIDPKSATAYNNVGAGYGAMQQWDKAIAAEEKAVQLNPGLQIAQNNLAWYLKQKAGDRGAPAAPAMSADKQAVDRLVDESNALAQAGKYDESIAAAKSALRLDPNSALAWNNIAAANEAMHKWDAAIDAATKAVALQPDFQLAKNNLAWSLSQKRLEAH